MSNPIFRPFFACFFPAFPCPFTSRPNIQMTSLSGIMYLVVRCPKSDTVFFWFFARRHRQAWTVPLGIQKAGSIEMLPGSHYNLLRRSSIKEHLRGNQRHFFCVLRFITINVPSPISPTTISAIQLWKER